MSRRKTPGYLLFELILELGLWLTGLLLAGPVLFQLEGLTRRSQLNLATQTTADTLSALQQRNLFLAGHHLQFVVEDQGARACAWRDWYRKDVLDLPRLGLADFALEGQGGAFTPNGNVEEPFCIRLRDRRDGIRSKLIRFQPVQGRMVYE
ncbi:hypothetical protein [Acidaminococcus fermentans]|uniref:hypothetical protein n=1 Tax=Acidaminococcus fermentans TaxID=905 RepID=UPI0024313363|nr:hypothetical protein [Acidaminococcus fermentans]MDD6287851.1 hypothetical protein [Acidaminococcus fermentans]